jgi:hypothetical protein
MDPLYCCAAMITKRDAPCANGLSKAAEAPKVCASEPWSNVASADDGTTRALMKRIASLHSGGWSPSSHALSVLSFRQILLEAELSMFFDV